MFLDEFMELIHKVCLLRTFNAFFSSVLPDILYHLFGVFEIKQGRKDVACKGARSSDPAPAMNEDVSLVLQHVIYCFLNNLLVPNIEVLRRRHLDNWILE